MPSHFLYGAYTSDFNHDQISSLIHLRVGGITCYFDTKSGDQKFDFSKINNCLEGEATQDAFK